MSFKSKCDLCSDETRGMVYECGPDTFGKTKVRICCRNYECNAFTPARLYPGEVMPEKSTEKDGNSDDLANIPDFRFTEEDKVPLFESEEAGTPQKPDEAKKKTGTKKTTRKKAEKK